MNFAQQANLSSIQGRYENNVTSDQGVTLTDKLNYRGLIQYTGP